MGDPAANNYSPQPATPPSFGLSVDLPVISKGRWQSGITYAPEGCVDGTTLSLYATGEKTPSNRPASVTWVPYILSVYQKCSTLGDDLDEARALGRRALLADTERQLAFEFEQGTISQSEQWQGAATPNTWLTDSTDPAFLTLEGAAVDPDQALRCLDSYLGTHNSGQPGAIHATIDVFDAWAQIEAIKQGSDGKWYTPTGNIVITSPGYTGAAPDDTAYAAGGKWAYATDMPRVFLDDIGPPNKDVQIVDRRNNDVLVLAERVALVEWERCRHAAIQVDIATCDLV